MTSGQPAEDSGGAGWLIAVVVVALLVMIVWNLNTRGDPADCDLVDVECTGHTSGP